MNAIQSVELGPCTIEPARVPALAQVLSHLTSTKLDATEALVLRFAGDTVWYRPAQVQRQGRAVREELTQTQFPEVAAVAATANAVCRLALLAQPPAG